MPVSGLGKLMVKLRGFGFGWPLPPMRKPVNWARYVDFEGVMDKSRRRRS
jgi:hypothetical protein